MQIILILENPPLFHLPFLPYDNLAYTALNVFWFTVICPFSQPTVPLSNNESRPSSLHSYLNLQLLLTKTKTSLRQEISQGCRRGRNSSSVYFVTEQIPVDSIWFADQQYSRFVPWKTPDDCPALPDTWSADPGCLTSVPL